MAKEGQERFVRFWVLEQGWCETGCICRTASVVKLVSSRRQYH